MLGCESRYHFNPIPAGVGVKLSCNELFTQPILNIEGTAPFLSILLSLFLSIFVKMFTAYKNWVFCLPDNLFYPLFSYVMKNF